MTDSQFQGTGSLGAALANGRRLLARDPSGAAAQAGEILRINPANRDALQLLAEALRRLGRSGDAEQAELRAVMAFHTDPLLAEAATGLANGDLASAERLLRSYLGGRPRDVAALTMLAEVCNLVSAYEEAESLLRSALTVTPSFLDARLSLSAILFRQGRVTESIELIDIILAEDPDNEEVVSAKATTLSHIGDYDQAVDLYAGYFERAPGSASAWANYGHVLKTVGRSQDAVAAFRKALSIDPGRGDFWWSIANFKTLGLGPEDVSAIRSALERSHLDPGDAVHLHFALGKALEDRKEHKASFGHYAEGNRIRRSMLPHDSASISDEVSRWKALATEEFLAERQGQGCSAPDPIFIVGMPRAGSTLVEQILSSHPQVEGTSELPYIPALARGLIAERWRPYPELLADLSGSELRSLGEEYLRRASFHRKTERPFFIDKLPNNWAEIGFIRLILPNARIIDARRHPLACCFSNFKEHFAEGQSFSYSLEDMALYYRDYVRLLAHFDTVAAGTIHRVIHERLIEDPEGQIRILLDFLGLPFDEACLRFHENERAVRTASSEQVRRPINRQGMDAWRPFEPWLEPLKRALGGVLERYPEVPKDL